MEKLVGDAFWVEIGSSQHALVVGGVRRAVVDAERKVARLYDERGFGPGRDEALHSLATAIDLADCRLDPADSVSQKHIAQAMRMLEEQEWRGVPAAIGEVRAAIGVLRKPPDDDGRFATRLHLECERAIAAMEWLRDGPERWMAGKAFERRQAPWRARTRS
jgi:hypothetical protein